MDAAAAAAAAAGKSGEPRFVIEADAAEEMMRDSGAATPEELLPMLVPAAKSLARAPISNYAVGAVALGASGRIYIGVNLEFPGLPLNTAVHAEQFLVANAAARGETGIRCIAVSSAPCGHCRQFLQEIRGASEIQILIPSSTGAGSGWESRLLADFLPIPFGPMDLLLADAPLLLEPHANEIGDLIDRSAPEKCCNEIGDQIDRSAAPKAEIRCNDIGDLIERSPAARGVPEMCCNEIGDLIDRSAAAGGMSEICCNDRSAAAGGMPEMCCNEIGELIGRSAAPEKCCNGMEMEEPLREAAEEGARAAHAPYSGCPSGFAVADGEGKVSGGAYLESAAYNPGLGPVAAAMVSYVAAGGGRWEGIVAAALVERKGAAVSHEGTARVVLAAVAPRAVLRVYRYRSPAAAAGVDDAAPANER